MNELKKEYIDELIAGFLSKGATPEEEEQLLRWITSGSSNRKYYEQMYRIWLTSAQCEPHDSEFVEKALKQVHKKTSELPATEKRLKSSKTQKAFLPVIIKYAAAIALLIISTYTLTRYSMTKGLESLVTGTSYEVLYGSRAYTTLSDGSKVWLNAGSKLTVHNGYNLHNRSVELLGEAYFDVEANPEKPFIVKAGELSIKATGTIFNIKAYPEEEQIITTLVEGVVFIENNADYENEFTVQLKPNQTVSYKRQAMSVESVTNDNTTAQSPLISIKQDHLQTPLKVTTSQAKTETSISWTRNRWIIDNEEFGQLAAQLERRYNVQIRFESEELKQYRFTGAIERETIEQLFVAFRYSIPFQYTIEKGIISISPDNELKKQYEKAWKR